MCSGNIDKRQPKLPPTWTAILSSNFNFRNDNNQTNLNAGGLFLKIAAALNIEKKE